MSNTGNLQRNDDWRKRLDGLVPQSIEAKHVLIIGCGSVGSFIASELVRSGVNKLTLVDPDIIEWANLTRTVYSYCDVGELKVNALSNHLKTIFPDLDITTHATPIQNIEGGFNQLLSNIDLVVAAVDQPPANERINRYCYANNKPVVFVGLYKGAKGGEVIITQPNKTPCFHCSTGGVRKAIPEQQREETQRTHRDYGTNRLLAEVALGSEIHFVCTAAIKIIMSLLSLEQQNSALASFIANPLDKGENFVIFGMESDYFLFPATHGRAVGQYAFQSIWIKTDNNPNCEVCGAAENREPIN